MYTLYVVTLFFNCRDKKDSKQNKEQEMDDNVDLRSNTGILEEIVPELWRRPMSMDLPTSSATRRLFCPLHSSSPVRRPHHTCFALSETFRTFVSSSYNYGNQWNNIRFRVRRRSNKGMTSRTTDVLDDMWAFHPVKSFQKNSHPFHLEKQK